MCGTVLEVADYVIIEYTKGADKGRVIDGVITDLWDNRWCSIRFTQARLHTRHTFHGFDKLLYQV